MLLPVRSSSESTCRIRESRSTAALNHWLHMSLRQRLPIGPHAHEGVKRSGGIPRSSSAITERLDALELAVVALTAPPLPRFRACAEMDLRKSVRAPARETNKNVRINEYQ